jgi:hypothetical protein
MAEERNWRELITKLLLLLLLLDEALLQETRVVVVGATSLGVNWGTMSVNPLPNSIVVQMLQANQITQVKLFDANPDVIKSMAGTDLEVMVAASNDELASLAADPAAAVAWVSENVTKYIGGNGVNIK